MIDLLKELFGIGPKVNFRELLQNGAIIVDVRTKNEYQGGHIKNSVNVPLANLQDKLSKLKKKNLSLPVALPDRGVHQPGAS